MEVDIKNGNEKNANYERVAEDAFEINPYQFAAVVRKEISVKYKTLWNCRSGSECNILPI